MLQNLNKKMTMKEQLRDLLGCEGRKEVHYMTFKISEKKVYLQDFSHLLCKTRLQNQEGNHSENLCHISVEIFVWSEEIT